MNGVFLRQGIRGLAVRSPALHGTTEDEAMDIAREATSLASRRARSARREEDPPVAADRAVRRPPSPRPVAGRRHLIIAIPLAFAAWAGAGAAPERAGHHRPGPAPERRSLAPRAHAAPTLPAAACRARTA